MKSIFKSKCLAGPNAKKITKSESLTSHGISPHHKRFRTEVLCHYVPVYSVLATIDKLVVRLMVDWMLANAGKNVMQEVQLREV